MYHHVLFFFQITVILYLYFFATEGVRGSIARGGTPRNSWWGCVARFFKSWPDFRPKNVILHTRSQTRPLKSIHVFRPGLNYVIATQVRAQKKILFKSISNSHISVSFLLIWNWNDKCVHKLRSSLENHNRFQTKMGKVYTRFQIKTAQKPYAMWQHIPIRSDRNMSRNKLSFVVVLKDGMASR